MASHDWAMLHIRWVGGDSSRSTGDGATMAETSRHGGEGGGTFISQSSLDGMVEQASGGFLGGFLKNHGNFQ